MRPPSWRDPRLILGAVLVLASVLGVAALVAAQGRTTPVYAADRTFTVGEQVTEDDLRLVEVQLGDGAQAYLLPGEELDAALVISRVEEGELVPVRALAEEDPEGRQPITAEISHELSRAVSPGGPVDVWASAPAEYGSDGEVERLVGGAELADVRERESAFGTQTSITVELLVGAEDVAAVLGAISDGRSLSVLPAQTHEPEQDEAEAEAEEDEG